jgi:hypothetical protein
MFFFLPNALFGQGVEILKKASSAKSINDTRFQFLNKDINSKSLVFIGTIKRQAYQNCILN